MIFLDLVSCRLLAPYLNLLAHTFATNQNGSRCIIESMSSVLVVFDGLVTKKRNCHSRFKNRPHAVGIDVCTAESSNLYSTCCHGRTSHDICYIPVIQHHHPSVCATSKFSFLARRIITDIGLSVIIRSQALLYLYD